MSYMKAAVLERQEQDEQEYLGGANQPPTVSLNVELPEDVYREIVATVEGGAYEFDDAITLGVCIFLMQQNDSKVAASHYLNLVTGVQTISEWF